MLRSRTSRRAARPHRSEWLPVPRRVPSLRHLMLLLILAGVALLMGQMLSVHYNTRSKDKLAVTLWELASQSAVEPRGIVLPLFNGIAVLGISLIMELRAMQIDLPIEVPHCGDLDEKLRDRLANDAILNVRVYDVCLEASQAKEPGHLGRRWSLFCNKLDYCHERFRSFDIKILSLLFSRFQELMLLDADVLFFQNPMSLWDLDKYVKTGTLFFHDRISFSEEFLGERTTVLSRHGERVVVPERSRLHEMIEIFDRKIFEELPTEPRRTENAKDAVKHGHHRPAFKSSDPPDEKRGTPSDFLRRTHAWNLRSGHQADSSVMLWNKFKQPRATAILGSFVSIVNSYAVPSYGEKEAYFLACELADSEYAFSDFGVGCIGKDWIPKERALCGDGLHFYPVKSPHVKDDDDIPALYINSDHIESWNPDTEEFYRTNARLGEHYPGSHVDRGLGQECPFDIKRIPLVEREKEAFRRRQRFIKTVQSWPEILPVTSQPPPNSIDLNLEPLPEEKQVSSP